MPDSYRVEHPGATFPYTDRFVLDTDDAAMADQVGETMPGSVMTEDMAQGKVVQKLPGVSRLVCLDVGGVLANKDTSDDYSHLEPLDGCKEFLEELQKHKVGTVVNSAHPVQEVTEWLKRYGLLELISGGAQLGDQRMPPVVEQKPRAEKYIDDRMVRYKGDYDEAMDSILEFRPWWADKDYEVDSVALDFDATINVYGMSGTEDEFNSEPPEPQEGAREFVAKLYSKVGRVVIFSCRPPQQIEAWLTRWKFDRHIDAIEDHKPKVKVYLDDRGMRFKGKYDKILDKLRLLEVEKGNAGFNGVGINMPPGNSTATPRVYGEPQTKGKPTLEQFAADVNNLARRASPWMPTSDKRYIADVWSQYDGNLTHGEFSKMLLEAFHRGLVS